MTLKELTLGEQIELLRKLDEEEKLYDKNLALASHDTYALKHKYNVFKEPGPLSSMYSAISQQPTVEAIRKLDQTIKNVIKPKELSPKTLSLSPWSTPSLPFLSSSATKAEALTPLKPDALADISISSDDGSDNNIISIADEEINNIIRENNFPTLDEIKKEEVDDVISNLAIYNKNVLGVKMATLSRAGKKNSGEYQSLKHHVEVLRNYRKKLIDLPHTTGTGYVPRPIPKSLVKFGRFYARIIDLHNNFLKIRKKNKTIVFDMPITEGVKNLILKRYEPNKYIYSNEDLKTFKEICQRTGYQPKLNSKLNEDLATIREGSLITTIKEAQKRMLHCIGEIRAGNNNVEIKNELVSLADLLLKHGKITKDEFKTIHSYTA